MVKILPAMKETRVQFLGWADPLEEGMTIHFSILAWRIPWTEEPGRLQSIRLQRVGVSNSATNSFTFLGVRASAHEFGRDKIQPIAPSY